jgi:hypothetical protein
MSYIDATVTARLSFEEKLVVAAEPEGKPGHYVATLTFPKEGNWEWSIQAFTMDQPMPVLSVAALGAAKAASASQPVTNVEPASANIPWLVIVRALVFGAALIGLLVVFQRRSRVAAALTGLCLLVGMGTFITGAVTPAVEAQSKSVSDAAVESPVSQIELGRQLFLAKGCITCHYNDKAASRSEYWTIEMGAPDLSKFSASPEVLFIRLKDPAAAKSDTKMPDLGLKETEIEALIAFINSK